MNARSEAFFDVHHLGSLVLHCDVVANDDGVHHGHTPCHLSGVDPGDVAHPQLPALALGSSLGVKCEWLGPS